VDKHSSLFVGSDNDDEEKVFWHIHQRRGTGFYRYRNEGGGGIRQKGDSFGGRTFYQHQASSK